jgi:WD40 repeat protein
MNRALLSTLALLSLAPAAVAQEAVSYAKHVRPFLAKYCLECHNAKAAKGGLTLETVKAIREGSDGGSVLEPGKPDESRIVLLVEGKDKPPMPPKSAKFHPTKEEIKVLRAWVAAGAKDDSADIKVVLPDIKPHNQSLPPVRSLAYDPGQQYLYYSWNHTLVRWTLEATPPKFTGIGMEAVISGLAFSPKDGSLAVAIGSAGNQSEVSYPELVLAGAPGRVSGAGNEIKHRDVILDLTFSPDGTLLATCGYDTEVKLTQFPGGKPLHSLKEHSDAVYGVAFSPDGKQLASCSADRAVKVSDVATGKLLYTLGEANDWLYTVAWSPDGKYLASGGVDKSIRVYAPGMPKAHLLHSVFAHEAAVQKLLFSKDSKTLYSVGQDGVLKAWDIERMVERKVYGRQPETVLSMALRPDGKQIALGRYDGVVVLIDEATGKVLAEIGADGPAKKDPAPAAKQIAPEKKAAPKVTQVTPAAAARGRTVEVTLRGEGLDQVSAIAANIPGAKVSLGVTGPEAVTADLTIPPTTSPGSYPVQLTTASGASASTSFIVDAYDAIEEKDAAGSPATGQEVSLPTTIVGRIDRAGDVDFFRFEVKAGQQLGIQIIAGAGSKLEPALQLTDLAGHVLAESNSGHLGWTFKQAGTYAIGVRDRELRGGPNMTYRLHLGEIPVVTATFPLGLQRGTEAEVVVEGVFLNARKVRVKAPAEAAPGSKVPLPLTTPLGAPLGTPQLTVGEFAEVMPELIHRNVPPASLGTLPVPGTANGVLRQPGSADTWTFHAKKGQRLLVEALARRIGSDLDSFIEILDRDGQPVPRAVLRCQAKTYVTFRDHDNVSPGIRIESWSELAVNDFLYVNGELVKIQELPPNPDADCTFFNNGGRLGYLDTTPTHHAMNTAMYKVTVHPPGSTFPPNGFPVFTLYYRNDDGGPGYGRDSRLFFDPPADGEYRVRVRDARGLGGPGFAYRLTVRPPRPSFAVRFSPTAPVVFKGGAVPVTLSVDRIDGYDGPIALHFEDLPAGLSAPPTVIEAGTFSTAVALYADANAQLPTKPMPLKLVGEALIDGQKQVKEAVGAAPKLIEPGELATFTEVPEVTIKPGGQATLTVRIERRAGVTGRVPLEVRGLPHGVRVLDIGLNGILINEGETRRTIVIYAEPWVQPGEHPFVVLSRRESKNTDHAAKSVLLRVSGK